MIPLQEYPRPSLRRESYVNLNGMWKYCFRKQRGCPEEYEGEILVPYSPEAELSGVGRQLQPEEWLYYERTFAAPVGQGGHVLLHFGAVDAFCRVWVNGILVGGHRGGYLPFTLEITDALREGENRLTVEVEDPSDIGTQARGKQKLKKGGMFYTAQSGIWQTVWLERVPEVYVRSLRMTPDPETGILELQVQGEETGRATAEAFFEGKKVAEGVGDETGFLKLTIPAADRHLWTPESPFLYVLTVTLPGGDRVGSYFALRRFSVGTDAKGIRRFFLNGEPYFLHGLLDQGYWKQGLYTPPSDEAMAEDIRTAKRLGFNLLRKHVKVEPERWYYHCDRLGMVVWQDMVNGGGPLPMWFVTYAANLFQPVLRRWKDKNYRLFARTDAESRAEYNRELAELVTGLYNHPCIGCWVPFNEGWGQFDARKATERIRALDPTRPVDEASGWFDQGGGDVYSIHNYFYPLRVKPDPGRVTALTEYGGVSWPHPEHLNAEKSYGYGTAKDGAEFAEKFRGLLEDTVLPQIKNGLSALVYTQLSDVEEEVNGILTFDREAVKLREETARDCAEKLKQEFRRCTRPAGADDRRAGAAADDRGGEAAADRSNAVDTCGQ